ncbi:MAG TPA: lipid-A-disaccharide synthase N-terminal domain-containing protein [Candidatus Omnitrophota bacterium]|nr:lipid-A-disaccharide synthase N-terminal domain-containing protein [Candidatus Omnitrophota bacterium]
MIWTLIGASAATLTMLSFIPQIMRSYKSKHVKDLSPVMLFQLSLGVSLWIIYGVHRKDPIIVGANSVTLITLIILIMMYFTYGKK